MAQFDIHDAQTRFSQLVEMAERGEEVIVARDGRPVVRLVPAESRKSILGIGAGDPNYVGGRLTDEEAMAPLDPEDLKLWYGENE